MFEQLVVETGLSKSTIQRLFEGYLKEPPNLIVYPSKREILLIDGRYFRRELYLILYQDNTIQFSQLFWFSDRKRSEELKENKENLLLLRVQFESITCDGHRALLMAIRKVRHQVTPQPCIIHVQRMCRIWLSSRPKSIPGKELRKIVSTIYLITSKQELSY